MNELIRVTQLPIIEERLQSLKSAVDTRVAEAVSLICTEETVQAVKAVRTDLRKQFNELEDQRKAVKAAVIDPYNQFEQVYKECVSDSFKAADSALKQKISDVEFEVKRRCEDNLREYFSELCAVNHLDFLRYEQSGVKVDMASSKQKTPKKLREQLSQFVARVSSDVDRIAGMEDAEEIMVEYKRTLNAMDAIGIIQERHRRIEEERAAMDTRETVKTKEVEAVKKVEAVAPPLSGRAPQEADPIFLCTFTVHATKTKLRKLKEFLNMEGIHYE